MALGATISYNTAPRNAWELMRDGVTIRVYRGDREEVFGKEPLPEAGLTWTLDDRMHIGRLFLGCGSRPGDAVLTLSHRNDDTKMAKPNLHERTEDLDPLGTLDQHGLPCWTWSPSLWQRWDPVKICFAGDERGGDEVCRFVGYLLNWTEDLATGVMSLHFVDVRYLMACAMVFGRKWYSHKTSKLEWLTADLPRFNRRGKPNMWDGKVSVNLPEKLRGFVDEDASNAEYWTPGQVWNYLRDLYTANVPKVDGAEVLVSFNKLLDWPEATSSGFGKELFEVSGQTNPNFDIDSGGLHLAHAIDVAVRKRSDLDWTVTYDGTTGKARLKIIGVGTETIDTAQRRGTLKRGDLGDNVTEAEAEVIGGRLTYSAAETRTRVRGMGAAKLYDLTFDTVAGTLEADWMAVDKTDWVNNYFDSDEDANKVYPSVYLRWVVPDSFDWTDVGWPVSVVRRRPTQAELQSFIGTDAQRRVRMQVWRSVDAGVTWVPCPEGIHPTVLHDRLGVLFPETARELNTHGDNEADEETYTWDEDTELPHDFRITVSVEAEERLTAVDQVWIPESASDPTFPPNWPVLETMVVEDNWGYAARVNAYLKTDADGNPVEDSETASTMGSAEAPDVIRNDGAVIGTEETTGINSGMPIALANIRSRLCRTAFTGTILLKGLRVDIAPGDYIWRLLGGGSEGTRPDIDIDAVIGSVDYAFTPETQTTTLELRAGA